MSLDVTLTRQKYTSYDKGATWTEEEEAIYDGNITHNLGELADKAGIYEALWRPYRLKPEYGEAQKKDYDLEMAFEESVTITASEIIEPLKEGLKKLKGDPYYYKQFDSPNGWGTYKYFVPFVEEYLNACIENPEAIVKVWR
jgi:hypothetical protein